MLQLRRITSSGRFIPEIDGLRFMAIASVVLYHLSGWVAIDGIIPKQPTFLLPGVEHGYRGVNLFYVISGFILGLPFAAHYLKKQPAVRLRAYFLRRLTRLEPPYILNLLLLTAALVIGNGARLSSLLPHLGASVVYLHNQIFGQASTINGVAWSLEIEVQFYCLAPILAGIFSVRSRFARRLALIAIMLLAGVFQRFAWQSPPRVRLSILFAIQFFLAGFLLADIFLTDWNQRPAPHWSWDLVSLVGWPLVFLPGDEGLWIYLPFLMLACCAGAFRGSLFRRLLRSPAITVIGGMCYTIYLFHFQLIRPILHWTKYLHIGTNFMAYLALQTLAYTPLLLLASGLYFLGVERPCMAKDWPRRTKNFLVRLRHPLTASA